MSTQHVDTTVLGTDVSLSFDKPWAAYWMFFLRMLTGWWFLHAGLTKIMEDGLMMPEGGLMWFMGNEAAITYPVMDAFTGSLLPIVQFLIPVGEFLIGLGLLVGLLTRLAAFNGALLMSFFYFGNMDWAHGLVNGDLMGLLLFITVAVFGAGRIWGLDAIVEKMSWVQKRPWTRYLLG